MLNNYLIDILITMLNTIASYNKLLDTIINTLYKIATTSWINFAKTPFRNLKFPRVPKILKILWGDRNSVSQWRIFCEVHWNFVSQCRKFWEVTYNFVP